jgi:hypothetical protein
MKSIMKFQYDDNDEYEGEKGAMMSCLEAGKNKIEPTASLGC